jgi:hypothetical protein
MNLTRQHVMGNSMLQEVEINLDLRSTEKGIIATIGTFFSGKGSFYAYALRRTSAALNS